jgi:death on curing protein
LAAHTGCETTGRSNHRWPPLQTDIIIEDAEIVKCAATYAYHLSQAHAFIDGNKRIAAAIMELFLNINQATLQAPDDDVESLILGIAAGRITRDEAERILSRWVVIAN